MISKKISLVFILFVIIVSFLVSFTLVNAVTYNTTQTIVNNPLDATNKKDIGDVWVVIVKTVLGFIGVATLVVFVYAGFTFLVSAGNAEKTKKARDTMIYAALGIFIAITAYTVLNFVFDIATTSVKPVESVSTDPTAN